MIHPLRLFFRSTILLAGVALSLAVYSVATIETQPVEPITFSVSLTPPTVVGGLNASATISVNGNAPTGGMVVALASSKPKRASVPPTVTIPAGGHSATFIVTTTTGSKTSAAISASYNHVTTKAKLRIQKQPHDVLRSVSGRPSEPGGGVTKNATLALKRR